MFTHQHHTILSSRHSICDALRNLVPFVQFKKRENTYGGVLSLACNFIKINTRP